MFPTFPGRDARCLKLPPDACGGNPYAPPKRQRPAESSQRMGRDRFPRYLLWAIFEVDVFSTFGNPIEVAGD